MKLTLELPTTPDELMAFADACRVLGIEHVDSEDNTALTGMLRPAVAVAPPVAPPAAPEPAKPKAPKPKARAKAKPATPAPRTGPTCAESILRHVADSSNGTFAGKPAELARIVWPQGTHSAATAISKMARDGLLEIVRDGAKVEVEITAKGLASIGAKSEQEAKPPAAPAPAVPARVGSPIVPLRPPAGGWA